MICSQCWLDLNAEQEFREKHFNHDMETNTCHFKIVAKYMGLKVRHKMNREKLLIEGGKDPCGDDYSESSGSSQVRSIVFNDALLFWISLSIDFASSLNLLSVLKDDSQISFLLHGCCTYSTSSVMSMLCLFSTYHIMPLLLHLRCHWLQMIKM